MQSSGDEPLTRVLVMTGKAIREDFEEALTRAGASLATWVVLNGIDRGRWESQRELATDLRIEGATLTRHLDRMERDGLIARTRDPDDRRQIRVELTKDGRALHRSLRTTAQKVGTRACEGLSQQDKTTLRRLLDQVRANVGGERADES
ncbi:MAG: MarR family winged helix-turn-helix transcriptional regulator, partial [Actinomycetota bacterium]